MNKSLVVLFVVALLFVLGRFSADLWLLSSERQHCASELALVYPENCVGEDVKVVGWIGWVGTDLVRIYIGPWQERQDERLVRDALAIDRTDLMGMIGEETDYLGDYVRLSGTMGKGRETDLGVYVYQLEDVRVLERLFFDESEHKQSLEELMYSM